MPDALNLLIADLRAVDVKDDAAFHALLVRSVDLLMLKDREIAHEFEVSRPTVTRWRNGLNAPHPALRKHVFTWLRERAEYFAKRQTSAPTSSSASYVAPQAMAARAR